MFNLEKMSDNTLGLFFKVINDLKHKSELLGNTGPLKIGNAPKGMSNDEYRVILDRLEQEDYGSYSMSWKHYWINEKTFSKHSFNELVEQINNEYRKREKLVKREQPLLPHYDQVNGILHINGFKIKIRKHDEDTKQNQLLKYIFSSLDISREFDFTEFPFDDVFDKTKFKEICRTACTAINEKCLAQSQDKVNSFLEFNTRTYGFLKINPKYLPGTNL